MKAFFSNLKNVWYCMLVLLILGIVLLFCAKNTSDITMEWILSISAVVSIILLMILNVVCWRCPHCRSHLGKLDITIKYCNHCGGKLE